eukprot:3935610-Rhodomonas_salina.1
MTVIASTLVPWLHQLPRYAGTRVPGVPGYPGTPHRHWPWENATIGARRGRDLKRTGYTGTRVPGYKLLTSSKGLRH